MFKVKTLRSSCYFTNRRHKKNMPTGNSCGRPPSAHAPTAGELTNRRMEQTRHLSSAQRHTGYIKTVVASRYFLKSPPPTLPPLSPIVTKVSTFSCPSDHDVMYGWPLTLSVVGKSFEIYLSYRSFFWLSDVGLRKNFSSAIISLSKIGSKTRNYSIETHTVALNLECYVRVKH